MVWGLMLAVTYYNAERILGSSYIDLENQQALNNIKRVHKAVEQLEEGVNAYVTNASVWNDAYQFALDGNKAYIESNMSVPIFLTSNIDMYLVYNAKASLVYGTSLNEARNKEVPVPSDLLKGLDKNGQYHWIVVKPKVDTNIIGLMYIQRGILYFGAHSIITSEGKGPPNGVMIMARFMDKDVINQLRKTTKMDLNFYNLSDISKDKMLNEKFSALQNKNNIIKSFEKDLYAYSLLTDVNNKPIGFFEISAPRSIYQTGMMTIYLFNTVFLAFGAAFVLLLFYLLNLLVIKRLEVLNKQVVDISKTKNFLPVILEEGTDEITALERQMNEMLLIIQKNDDQRQTLLNEIEHEMERVNNFSDKLKESEKFLESVINSILSMLIIVDDKMNIKRLNVVAKEESQNITEEAENKSIWDIFPYLKNYWKDFDESLKQQKIKTIEKVNYYTSSGNRYFNVILYPMNQEKKQFLVIRIDDVTEQVGLEEKLIQNNKLASIGVLTAGVAHEMNNPVNFLSAAITPLRNNLSEMKMLLDKYAELGKGENIQQQLKTIDELKQSIDLPYLIKETNELLEGIKDGSLRTATVAGNLRTFSRADEGAARPSDIHAMIDSALNLLHHECKNRITIHKEYGSIPAVSCFPGKLNQALMNVLTNAVESVPPKREGNIWIKTTITNDKHVIINIKDDGVGISQENVSKVFDPFFTTKAVGQGMGLGLSTAAATIREHNGLIEIKSREGKGTEIMITLPVDQPIKPIVN